MRRTAERPPDLSARPIPRGDWGDPPERLDELYRWAEEGALRVADWYLADRAWKRRGARARRARGAPAPPPRPGGGGGGGRAGGGGGTGCEGPGAGGGTGGGTAGWAYANALRVGFR
ncbi:SLATT domain-containing protein, partial [Streptomyces sp. HSW2009]|uniref:SLATT domain-containing protein n=1 Tax=Streptomyces sp. HSW2009 TaxID=3142890 RepID=UPI0032EDB63F